MPGSWPLGRWVSATTRRKWVKPGTMSKFQSPVSAASAASPVQPFFSRCGQSVGMPVKLDLKLCKVCFCKVFSMASEESNVPFSANAVCTKRASSSSTSALP